MIYDEVRVLVEILKIMFNITINFLEFNSIDIFEYCERIVFIVRFMFVYVKFFFDYLENFFNYVINIVSNMLFNCFKYFMWIMSFSVFRKFV